MNITNMYICDILDALEDIEETTREHYTSDKILEIKDNIAKLEMVIKTERLNAKLEEIKSRVQVEDAETIKQVQSSLRNIVEIGRAHV